MRFCAGCGGRLPDGARFCPGCGSPVVAPTEPPSDPGPPVPGPVGPVVALTIPPWVSSDWVLAVVCAFGGLVALFGIGAIHGAVMGFTALGAAGIGLGAIAGTYIPFIALGGDTAAVVNNAGDGVFLAGSAMLVSWLAVPVLVGRRALRFGLARVQDTAAGWAFVVKLAVLLGVGFGIAGGLAGSAQPEESFGDDGFSVAADVGAGEAGFWLVLLVLVLGAVVLRAGTGPLAGSFDAGRRLQTWTQSWGRLVLRGGLAWGSLVLAAGAGLVVAGVVAADGTSERILVVEAAPAVVVNGGVAGAAIASGASVDTTASLLDLPMEVEGRDRSLSLFHFDLPPDDESGPAPLYLFPLLLLAPAAVAVTTWRALGASRPPGEQDALRVAFAVTGGFVLAAWLGSTLAPLAASGGARGDGTEILRSAVARPSVGGTVGLALVWALAASLGTALVWINGQTRLATPATPPPSPPVPPPLPVAETPPAPPQPPEGDGP
ncbi:MAG: hypothetical protein ACRDZ3_08130 [Acidimicrobiia bacterium]